MNRRVEVPVAVTARNEERALPACLRSLQKALACYRKERRWPIDLRPVVVLDDTTDGSETVARAAGFDVLRSTGGLVEAQRRVVSDFAEAPFVIFSDADVRVGVRTLIALVNAMREHPRLRVAYPRKRPVPPRRRHLLARALYAYNRNSGLQTRRHYFNGLLFAIRDWQAPNREELIPRLARIPKDRFYDFHAGLRVDDIYLSRRILMEDGPQGIFQVEGGVWFRPPETFEGMYRTYRRMRMEIERLDVLFPESVAAHRRWGVRGTDRSSYRRASRDERILWYCFQSALVLCRLRYRAEKFYYQRLSLETCNPWRSIRETKEPIVSGFRSRDS